MGVAARARPGLLGREIDRARPRQRHRRGDHLQIDDIPLADPITVRTLGEIEMNVLLVVAVRTRPQYGGEAGAGERTHLLAKRLRYLRIGEREGGAVLELDRADVDGVALAVL
jgi:hypothetical protein